MCEGWNAGSQPEITLMTWKGGPIEKGISKDLRELSTASAI